MDGGGLGRRDLFVIREHKFMTDSELEFTLHNFSGLLFLTLWPHVSYSLTPSVSEAVSGLRKRLDYLASEAELNGTCSNYLHT